jgi:hypothetical protein
MADGAPRAATSRVPEARLSGPSDAKQSVIAWTAPRNHPILNH